MKRTIWLLWLAAAAVSLHAATMHELFDALKKEPVTKLDAMQADYASLSAKKIRESFYPRVSLFAAYEHYSSPTNLRPISPVESQKIALAHEPLPFATTIERVGAQLSMPIFAKELFSLKDLADAMAKSAKTKKRLNLLQNEALLLGSDASWLYLDSLEKAMYARRRSIQKILEDTRIKVESGRSPGIALDKMEESINALDIAINDIAVKKTAVKSAIEALTGIRMESPAPLKRQSALKDGEIFATEPLKYIVEAKRHEVKSAYAKLYPKVALIAKWSENYGQNAVGAEPGLSDDVHRGYGSYTVALSVPLFAKGDYTEIERAKIDLEKERYRLAKTEQELIAKAAELKKSLELYERSKVLAKRSVGHQKSLLKYAKVAFDTGRLSEEEYLRYEKSLLEAQSRVYEADSKYWQTLAQLAVIYGNDLADIVE